MMTSTTGTVGTPLLNQHTNPHPPQQPVPEMAVASQNPIQKIPPGKRFINFFKRPIFIYAAQTEIGFRLGRFLGYWGAQQMINLEHNYPTLSPFIDRIITSTELSEPTYPAITNVLLLSAIMTAIDYGKSGFEANTGKKMEFSELPKSPGIKDYVQTAYRNGLNGLTQLTEQSPFTQAAFLSAGALTFFGLYSYLCDPAMDGSLGKIAIMAMISAPIMAKLVFQNFGERVFFSAVLMQLTCFILNTSTGLIGSGSIEPNFKIGMEFILRSSVILGLFTLAKFYSKRQTA